MGELIQFRPRVAPAPRVIEVDVQQVLSETVTDVNLANYRAKIQTFSALHDAGFEVAALQCSLLFLENLRRAAMRCDPRVAPEIYAASRRLLIKLVS